ncbi:MAG: PIN domain-containing protein [Planctomycetes bacterium]|nr:PIN domain-containing protein [Planctomycetota bacterium]
MILLDAGPMLAIFDKGDADHRRCVEELACHTTALWTTWPALTEGMYLLGQRGGWFGQNSLWGLVLRDAIKIAVIDSTMTRRAYLLMKQYSDLPMDFADATLVAAAEALGTSRIFTLDDDFRMYRLPGRKSFQLIPG